MTPETTPTTLTTPTRSRALNTPTTTPTMGNCDESLGAGWPTLCDKVPVATVGTPPVVVEGDVTKAQETSRC